MYTDWGMVDGRGYGYHSQDWRWDHGGHNMRGRDHNEGAENVGLLVGKAPEVLV